MTQIHQSASLSLAKHKCCKTHLKPLLQRVNTLQHKLLIETERRQKEYNQLLHILVTVKHQKNRQNQSSQTHNHKTKFILTKQALIQKVKCNKITFNRQNSPISKSIKKTKPLRRSSENIKTKDQTILIKDNPKQVWETLDRHQSELTKTKQLSNYLMQQLLILFEKVREAKVQNTSTQGKGLPTQQTLNSMVFDVSHKNNLISNQNMNNNFGQKIQKMESILGQSNAKIVQHQNMLSDLIALTRNLNSKIVKIPLYLDSNNYDVNH